MAEESIEGTCEGCGKSPRMLNRIESGQMICRFCLRELRPTIVPAMLAKLEQIHQHLAAASPNPKPGMRMRIRDLSTYVAGVQRDNDDGTSRQEIIQSLSEDDPLELVRDRDNTYSDFAVGVYASLGQIGYIPSRNSFEVAEGMDAGFPATASIRGFLPPNERFPESFGVIIDVEYAEITPIPRARKGAK